MKKFFIFYIILLLIGFCCLYYRFGGYRFGYADETGKIVLPIKYIHVYAYPSIYDEVYNQKPNVHYVGLSLTSSDHLYQSGYKFKSKNPYDDRLNNLICNPMTQKTYYNNKLIAKRSDISFMKRDIFPYVEALKLKDNHDGTCATTSTNYLNTENGTFLFPKFSHYEYKNGHYILDEKTYNEVYDKTGKKICHVNLKVGDFCDDLIIGNFMPMPSNIPDYNPIQNYMIFNKKGELLNQTSFNKYNIYNNKIYIIFNGIPFVFNKENNTFDKTDIDYIVKDYNCIYVHKKGKFGVIIDDYESPIIYDDISDYKRRAKTCIVKQGDKYGVIGPDTNIPCIYTAIGHSLTGFYKASKTAKPQRHFTQAASSYYDSKIPGPPYKAPSTQYDPQKLLNVNNSYTVVDKKGKELLPPKYNDFQIYDKYIFATGEVGQDKKIFDIYDKDGNFVKSLQTYLRRINDRLAFYDDRKIVFYDRYKDFKVMDMDTLKTYDSVKDYIIFKNPDNELLKDCDVSEQKLGFTIKYKKKLF